MVIFSQRHDFYFSCEPNTPETCATLETFRLFTIYIGNPVGLWFGQMVRKIQDWFHSESCLPFARITSLYLKATESKMGFNKWYPNFRLEHFVRKTGLPCQMFRLLFNRIFRKLFCSW